MSTTTTPLDTITVTIPKNFNYKQFNGWGETVIELIARGFLLLGVLVGTAISLLITFLLKNFTDNDFIYAVVFFVPFIGMIIVFMKLATKLLKNNENKKNHYRDTVAFPNIAKDFVEAGWKMDDFDVAMLANNQSTTVKDANGVSYSFRHFSIYSTKITAWAVLNDEVVLAKQGSEKASHEDIEAFADFIAQRNGDIKDITPSEYFIAGLNWKK